MTSEVKMLLGVGVVTLSIVVGAVFFLSKDSDSQPAENDKRTDNAVLIREDSFNIATDSAKVTIVEFSDFQCPACKAANPIMKKVLTDFAGQVNFVYRHFPLPQHKNAVKAAEAAEAAGEQGKFWQMQDKLFEGQEEWAEVGDPREKFLSYAQELGLDMDKFKTVVDSKKFATKIDRDKGDGLTVGINSTPTFFINGEKNPGVLTYEQFREKIDQELQK